MKIKTKGKRPKCGKMYAVEHFSDHHFHINSMTQCKSFGSLELLDQPG